MSLSCSRDISRGRFARHRTTPTCLAAAVALAISLTATPVGAAVAPGTVWSWGFNEVGQLGDGSTTQSAVPREVRGLTNVIDVVGDGDDGYALTATGQVYAWGLGTHGELGNGTTVAYSKVPVLVKGLTGLTITAVAAAGEGSSGTGYVLTSTGTVWAWGYGVGGALGNGGDASSSVPVQITSLSGVTALAGGGPIGGTTYALLSNGTVWAWGVGTDGELGDGSYSSSAVPVQVQGITNAVSIAAGETNGYAVLQTGTVMAWGEARIGTFEDGSSLGDNSFATRDVPIAVQKVTGAVQVAGGGGEAYAVTSSGRVWAWGSSNLGNGNVHDNGTKVPVLLKITGVEAVGSDISAGIALKTNGTVWAWGSSYYGEVADGTVGGRFVASPLQVRGLTNVVALAPSGAFVIKD